jgi:D-amino-acid dehydrogenase
MRVIVLGAGVVGVTSAYYLTLDGHDVTVLDRNNAAASETSYGNAGLVSPGDSYAWASPAALGMFVKSLYRHDLGIKVRPQLDRHFLSWTMKFLLQCTHERARINTLRKLRLALYSKACFDSLVAATGIEFGGRCNGILYFYRTTESLDSGAAHMQLLADHGLSIEIVTRDRLIALDPGLRLAGDRIAGGIFSPMDQTADSCRFSRSLAAWCAKNGSVRFLYDTTVAAIEVGGDRVTGVVTDRGLLSADAFVLAAGAESPRLTRPIGIDLPICPVKGYSVTSPIRKEERAPKLGGVDEDRLVAYSRLGDRVRIAARAEFAGYDRTYRTDDFRILLGAACDLFGDGLDLGKAEYWTGLRPMTPSSVPILGPARYRNFHLNVGHGHVGWTMACGSGKFTADLIGGRRPEIDPEGLLYAA